MPFGLFLLFSLLTSILSPEDNVCCNLLIELYPNGARLKTSVHLSNIFNNCNIVNLSIVDISVMFEKKEETFRSLSFFLFSLLPSSLLKTACVVVDNELQS